jgi:hypothetical protein
MKILIPVLSLMTCSCAQYTIIPNMYVNAPEEDSSQPGDASHLIRTIQRHDSEKWRTDIQKIKDTYTRAIKVLDDNETIQFTVAFFKMLSVSEDLNQQILELSKNPKELPNVGMLKLLYKVEKELDEMIALAHLFAGSSNFEIQQCAIDVAQYLRCQKHLFIAIRDVDYRGLKGIPSEVLRADAKFLEQREQMANRLTAFYANLADERLSKLTM